MTLLVAVGLAGFFGGIVAGWVSLGVIVGIGLAAESADATRAVRRKYPDA